MPSRFLYSRVWQPEVWPVVFLSGTSFPGELSTHFLRGGLWFLQFLHYWLRMYQVFEIHCYKFTDMGKKSYIGWVGILRDLKKSPLIKTKLCFFRCGKCEYCHILSGESSCRCHHSGNHKSLFNEV